MVWGLGSRVQASGYGLGVLEGSSVVEEERIAAHELLVGLPGSSNPLRFVIRTYKKVGFKKS